LILLNLSIKYVQNKTTFINIINLVGNINQRMGQTWVLDTGISEVGSGAQEE
jgi:hypothetical protein